MELGAFALLEREEFPSEWDAVVIGGGPGGIAASIYLARFGLRALIIEKKAIGGTATLNPIIENYPAFSTISGQELGSRLDEHARAAGAKFLFPDEVIEADLKGHIKTVRTAGGNEFTARLVILATGAEVRKLGVSGEDEFYAKGVSYCAVCDGPLFKGKKLAVIGGGDTAAISSVFLASIADVLYLIHRRDRLRAEKALQDKLLPLPNVRTIFNTEVIAILGSQKVEGVKLRNRETGEESSLEVDGVFIFVGQEPNSELARESGVETDEKGFVVVDPIGRTNVPGVYAIGDLTPGPMQISKAIGDGAKAAIDAYGRVFCGPYAGSECAR